MGPGGNLVTVSIHEAKSHLNAPVRWGIIGCGDVTEVKSGPAFQRAVGSELVAVMRRNGELAADYARRHGVPRWYDDADGLIADPDVDAIYVATPVSTHTEYALRSCAAGKPAYVEKPMARSHAECMTMVEAFRGANLPLYVAYYRRGQPRFLKVRELVQSGALGTVTSVVMRYQSPEQRSEPGQLPWRLNAEHSGGGLVMDLGSHALDIVDFILGPLELVTGRAANVASDYDVEDSVVLTFLAGGVPGVALWNFASATSDDLLEIAGTRGRVSLSVFGNEPVRFEGPDRIEEFDLRKPRHVQQPLIQTVVDDLLGRGKCESTGESGARTNRVLDVALSEYYGGRDGAFWDRPETWPGLAARRRGR